MKTFHLLAVLLFSLSLWGKTEVTELPEKRKSEKEAAKYFSKKAEDIETPSGTLSPQDHYLSVHLGSFVSSHSYSWGDRSHVEDTGRLTGGLTYRLGPMSSLFDWALRVDFLGNELPEGRTVLMGVYPMILFPEAGSYFPLYFGLGFGPGIFFQQLKGESSLAFTYQLVAGVRLFNLIGDTTGFFLEGGMKNHILLLSDGQFNGFFISVGPIFTF